MAEETDDTLKTCTFALALLRSSKSRQEWDENCDKILRANGGVYPPYWYTDVVLPNLVDLTLNISTPKSK